jgi:hypothetical protein
LYKIIKGGNPMSEKKVYGKDTAENIRINPDSLAKSSEQTVCAPEFPSGCIDLEDEEDK